MSANPHARLYLATPIIFDAEQLAEQLAEVLADESVACLRMRSAESDQSNILRCANRLREAAHAADVPIVIDNHFRMVSKAGLDGVHLTDSHRTVREARSHLGADAIIGAYCGTSRHAGMTAAEIGCDYVSFGPVSQLGELGDGNVADADLFQWWSEMIEVPVVAEGHLTMEMAKFLKDKADFLMLGDEVWSAPDPIARLQEYAAILK